MAYKAKTYVSPATRRAKKEKAGIPCQFLNRSERRKRAKFLRTQRKIEKGVEEVDNVFTNSTEE